jgi:hypothetical protein
MDMYTLACTAPLFSSIEAKKIKTKMTKDTNCQASMLSHIICCLLLMSMDILAHWQVGCIDTFLFPRPSNKQPRQQFNGGLIGRDTRTKEKQETERQHNANMSVGEGYDLKGILFLCNMSNNVQLFSSSPFSPSIHPPHFNPP